MDDSTPQEQQPERRFRVKLFQTQEVLTEQFEELNGEPLTGNKKDALKQVQNFIDDEKDLEGVEYRLEVEEIEEPQIGQTVPVVEDDDQPSE